MSSYKYEKILFDETRNLLDLAQKNEIPKAMFREGVIKRILEAFGRKRSVLLVGPAGVGKTAIVYGLAHEMRLSRHRELRELSTVSILTGTHYLGDWQTKLGSMIKDAKAKKVVLYFTDIWNLRTVGSSSNDPSTIFDLMRQHVQAGELLLLGEATHVELAVMQRNPQLIQTFEHINVEPLSEAQYRAIVEAEADRLKLELLLGAVDKILDLCKQFMPQCDGPGPAMLLVKQVAHYFVQKLGINEIEPLDENFIEKVFSIYSGMPLFIVSRSKVKPAKEMRAWFRERVIGQDEAIEAVLETIALYKSGLHDSRKPIGSFLFVGPTGVGKTELAKALAMFLFGSQSRLLRFDMSEFKDYHAFELLMGSPHRQDRPARLLDPVKAQPFQVILFDEIEKAHANIWDLLLQLLDEGRLTSPHGGTVNFCNTIIIATSNVGANEVNAASIGFTESSNKGFSKEINKHLEQVFRPEMINRFGHVVPFYNLRIENVKLIARRELKAILSREGISGRNLVVETGDDVLEMVISKGYDRQYGARALKRQLEKQVVLSIANYLLENIVYPGAILKLGLYKGNVRVRVLETEQSLEQKREIQPIISEDGKRYTVSELINICHQAKLGINTLSEEVGESQLQKKLNEYQELRNQNDFWANREQAYLQILKADEINKKLTRLEKLSEEQVELENQLQKEPSRKTLEIISRRLSHWQKRYQYTKRELVTLGDDGNYDAIIQISPIGNAAKVRDLMYSTYREWGLWRNFNVISLSEPIVGDSDSESDCAGLLIKGAYSYGMLRLEAGLHRYKEDDQTMVVRVIVAPVYDMQDDVKIDQRIALKKGSIYGGKIRSRMEIQGSPNLVLQNQNVLADNNDLAREIGVSWNINAHSNDDVVRRYDMDPFLVRDSMTGTRSGKQDFLKPKQFNELLSMRVDYDLQSH